MLSLTAANGEVRDEKDAVTTLERTRIRKYREPFPDEENLIAEFRRAVGHPDIRVSDGSSSSFAPKFGGPDDEGLPVLPSLNDTQNIIIMPPDDKNSFENLVACETQVCPPSPDNAALFATNRKSEIDVLLETNAFGVMKREDALSDSTRIFKFRFVDAVKYPNSPKAVDKSRFMICGYNDKKAAELLTKALTVDKHLICVFLSLAASVPSCVCMSSSHGTLLKHLQRVEHKSNDVSFAKHLPSSVCQMNTCLSYCVRFTAFRKQRYIGT